jgi:hypothetical protein
MQRRSQLPARPALIGTALAASCARDGIAVSALVRDTARGAELLPSAKLSCLGRDARLAAGRGVRGRRRPSST